MYDCQQLQLMYQVHQVKNDNDYTKIKSRIKEEKKWWYGTSVNMSKKLQNNRPARWAGQWLMLKLFIGGILPHDHISYRSISLILCFSNKPEEFVQNVPIWFAWDNLIIVAFHVTFHEPNKLPDGANQTILSHSRLVISSEWEAKSHHKA